MTDSFISRLRQFQTESQGVLSCELIEIDAARALLDGTSAHDRAFARCLCRFIQQVESGKGTGCLCCNYTPFTVERFPLLFAFAWPARAGAKTGMFAGVCGPCALRPAEAIFGDARRSLSLLWPNLKSLKEAPPAGRA